MNKYLFTISLIFILSVCSLAQKGWELGGWLGTSYYFGDLNTEFRLNRPGLAGGLMARYNFNTRVSVSNSFNFGRIRAKDEDSSNSVEKMRNLSFYSNVFDLSSTMDFNFFNYVHGTDEWYTPYVFGGFSVFSYSPKAELDGDTYNLRDFTTEGQLDGESYGNIHAAFTYGIGMKWDINEEWSFNLSLGSRSVFTDYLDDVSNTYPDQNTLTLTQGPIAAQLSDRSGIDGFATQGRQRGDSKENDSYHFIGIGLMRYFGNLECPKISNF